MINTVHETPCKKMRKEKNSYVTRGNRENFYALISQDLLFVHKKFYVTAGNRENFMNFLSYTSCLKNINRKYHAQRV